MATSTVIAIYFIVWWVVLCAVLPWGVRSQEESGEVVPGTDPGAPAVHTVWMKLLYTPRSTSSISFRSTISPRCQARDAEREKKSRAIGPAHGVCPDLDLF